ncbi:Alpha/Beta hydrolase protein [Talaromyces proteolyticus]|uniref:Alpha/Beta hydrolase protein n=1 Tax=Talaromyces proteolyticus TaxID=1131652 RepID=A0AAD4KI59_9EURO|nr:Alpha/Beta hydrolase protein [Talaromyces proteolyticus]KAH8691639.1 Alpha/Beta hydrolase protein [Talaromyces proteolyticus]
MGEGEQEQKVDGVHYTQKTYTFKKIKDKEILLDVYSVDNGSIEPASKQPAVLFFHYGYVITGDRYAFPKWLLMAALRRGWTFISADHRCLPESTGHDAIEDCVDAYFFVVKDLSSGDSAIDPNRIIIAGSSGGGYCAVACSQRLVEKDASIEELSLKDRGTEIAIPRPVAVLAIYPMIDLLSPWWTTMNHEENTLSQKELDQVRGQIDQDIKNGHISLGERFAEKDEDLIYQSRWPVLQYVLQTFTYADYLSGIKGLSQKIALNSSVDWQQYKDMKARTVPESAQKLFPIDFDNMSSKFPPLFIVHGTGDRDVPIEDSKALVNRCGELTVPVRHWWLPGLEHCFDLEYDDLESSIGEKDLQVGPAGLRELIVTLDNFVCAKD